MVRQLNGRLDLAKSSSKETPDYHSLAQFVGKLIELWKGWMLRPETHIQRQAALHDCLPWLLGDGGQKIEKVYGEEKNILYLAD
jgi:hypothetical protein